jgi:hypothetical protein
MFAWVAAQLSNPPWNQPQVTPCSFSRSPMLRLLESTEAVLSRVSQASPVGWGSPITVPFEVTPELVCANPCVCPLIRLSAPGVDGPNTVL